MCAAAIFLVPSCKLDSAGRVPSLPDWGSAHTWSSFWIISSEAEKKAICFLAFPDSNADVIGDSVFCFRTPYSANEPAAPPARTSAHLAVPGPGIPHAPCAGTIITGVRDSAYVHSCIPAANGRSPKASPRSLKRQQQRYYYGSVFFRCVAVGVTAPPVCGR